MKVIICKYQVIKSFFFIFFLIVLAACSNKSGTGSLIIKDYPDIRLGFSTQNFQLAMPNNLENLKEIIEYASKEGYHFIELRDDLAKLSTLDCIALADVAKNNKIEVIYEIHKNPLDTGFFKVFERGLTNATLFSGPGILRTVVSKSEFDADPAKKGWNKEEFMMLVHISDSCAAIAKAKNIQFVVENFNEAFFGESPNYFGLSDFFDNTSLTGLQLDMSNPFRKPVRVMADPEKVVLFLSSLGTRWITTHLKTILVMGGDMQPVLTENPLPVEKIIAMMGQQNVKYAALELASVADKQQCFENHSKSIRFLKEKGILKN